MNHKSLDEMIRLADNQHPISKTSYSGKQIRLAADRRSRSRRRIAGSLGTVAMLGTVLLIWWSTQEIPPGPRDAIAQSTVPEESEDTGPDRDVLRIQSEIEAIRAERQQLVQQLEFQRVARRAARTSERLAFESQFLKSPEQSAAIQSAAYSLLLAWTGQNTEIVNQEVRSDLESLIRYFPNTQAASQAQQLLAMQ